MDQQQSTPDAFAELDISIDAAARTYWCMMRPAQPSFRPNLLAELSEMQMSLRRLFDGRSPDDPPGP